MNNQNPIFELKNAFQITHKQVAVRCTDQERMETDFNIIRCVVRVHPLKYHIYLIKQVNLLIIPYIFC